jgi:predicted short-subunit dehydrogenase-like oxidoreductase (DUF2520 family)
MNTPLYGIVGRGRVATHMARYLQLETLPFTVWHRGLADPPEQSLAAARVVLLAIADDALDPFLAAHPRLLERTVVHFSGSRVIDGVPGLHPLMTFGPEPYDRATYRSIPFIVERGAPGFDEVFPALSNPWRTIDPALKPLYHALCVMAGNCPTLLWQKVFVDFEARLGLPADLLAPYLRRTLENTLGDRAGALTGPLARGDRATVERNLEALGGDPWAGVYRAFASCHGVREVVA